MQVKCRSQSARRGTRSRDTHEAHARSRLSPVPVPVCLFLRLFSVSFRRFSEARKIASGAPRSALRNSFARSGYSALICDKIKREFLRGETRERVSWTAFPWELPNLRAGERRSPRERKRRHLKGKRAYGSGIGGNVEITCGTSTTRAFTGAQFSR